MNSNTYFEQIISILYIKNTDIFMTLVFDSLPITAKQAPNKIHTFSHSVFIAAIYP